ncbi:hypothetical protein EDD11_002286 [Mortierella claussenii]|nr:hypothetical protein EDD11_002286 [Mortierella claussenii]
MAGLLARVRRLVPSSRVPFLTLFHNPSDKESVEVLRQLQRVALHYKFAIDLVQSKNFPPPPQQIECLVHYLGEDGLNKILIPTAPRVSTLEEVQKLLQERPSYMKKPLLVDWAQCTAVIPSSPESIKEIAANVKHPERKMTPEEAAAVEAKAAKRAAIKAARKVAVEAKAEADAKAKPAFRGAKSATPYQSAGSFEKSSKSAVSYKKTSRSAVSYNKTSRSAVSYKKTSKSTPSSTKRPSKSFAS